MPYGSSWLALDDKLFPAGHALAGTVVAGRYRVVQLLGSGGLGDVYLADPLQGDLVQPLLCTAGFDFGLIPDAIIIRQIVPAAFDLAVAIFFKGVG